MAASLRSRSCDSTKAPLSEPTRDIKDRAGYKLGLLREQPQRRHCNIAKFAGAANGRSFEDRGKPIRMVCRPLLVPFRHYKTGSNAVYAYAFWRLFLSHRRCEGIKSGFGGGKIDIRADTSMPSCAR